MHELSIASSLVDKILEFAAERQVKKVLEVRLAVGELTCLQPEQLRFCFEAITQDTVLAGASLDIEEVKVAVECPQCGYRGVPKHWDETAAHWAFPTLGCPTCGGTVSAVQGHECAIRTLRVVEG